MDISFFQNELKRVSDWIGHAEKKATILIAFYTFSFGYLIQELDSIKSFLLETPLFCFFTICIVSVVSSWIIGIFYAYLAVKPVLSSKRKTGNSLFYFKSISEMDYVEYMKRINKLKDKEVINQLHEQIYVVSVIASKKMRHVERSIFCLFVVFVFSIIVVSLINL